jgi:hypothetical protein
VRYGAAVVAAPYQPSAHEENDVGFDVLHRIRYGGFVRAIFLQYKVSNFITRRRDLDCFAFHREPHFRFGLLRGRGAPYYAQHNRLVALRQMGYSAHYCAPLFFLRDQLELHYGRNELLEQSFFGDPRAIGTLYEGDSDLRDLGRAATWQDVLDNAEPRDIDEAALDDLANSLREAVERASAADAAGPVPPTGNELGPDDELTSLREISALTKHYLGAALLLLPG